jgi:hypothetical protein
MQENNTSNVSFLAMQNKNYSSHCKSLLSTMTENHGNFVLLLVVTKRSAACTGRESNKLDSANKVICAVWLTGQVQRYLRCNATIEKESIIIAIPKQMLVP